MRIARMIAALRRTHRNERGLTAIELAVVVAILAVLAGLVASNTTGMSNSARGSTQNTDIAEVQKAVDNYVGQNPAAKYPVSSTLVNCDTAATITGTVNTASGLPTSDCVQLNIAATYSTPDTTVVTKTFVPDFMQRAPKHVTETPNPWVVNANGSVKNTLTADKY